MLLQIREYINREGVVSTQQLTREFRVSPSALQPMLDIWVKQGMIQKCQEKDACQSTCFKCRTGPEYYQSIKS